MTIRNDATRQVIPVGEARPLRGVVARQGQVLLDTDINELERTLVDRVEGADAAMLGPPDRLLYPAGTGGFTVSGTAADCTIAAGTGYLKGWQLVNPAPVTLATQPNPWTGTTPGAAIAVVLKALVRHIDPVEDIALADAALGDAQASGRALNDWQAFLYQVPAGTTCPAITGTAEWQALVAPSSGTLAFQIPAPGASSDPCSLTPAGGHSRFENLLYRIEVHGGTATAGGPTADGPRFRLQGLKLKLSRRNGSLMARITQVNAGTTAAAITVSPPALDPRAWFAAGAYAEIVGPGDDIDPTAALAKERLFKVALASDEVITLSATPQQIGDTGAKADGKWFLRLWDAWPSGDGVATVPANGGPIDLGDGISIRLAGGTNASFRRGDHWTAAVRADGTIAWPGLAANNPAQQPPQGPELRYAPLAILENGIADCRIPFATLSDRALLYRGGDGQEAFAPVAAQPTPVALPRTLRVAVMRGATPVPGARVRWQTAPGAPGGWVQGTDLSSATVESITAADGLAEVTWSIDARQQDVAHAVEAVLLDEAQPAATPPVRFGAQFATAAHTSYTPGDCPTLARSTNVQDALDALCAALGEPDPRTLRLRRITLLGLRQDPTELIQGRLILNALEVSPAALTGGIRFEIAGPAAGRLRRTEEEEKSRDEGDGRGGQSDATLQLGVRPYDPVAEIALDIPYPLSPQDGGFWLRLLKQDAAGASVRQWGAFGFTTVRLDGAVEIDGDAIVWRPGDYARILLMTAMSHRFGSAAQEGAWRSPPLDRVLCRIRLRSALIFATDPKTDERMWLNAEHLGTRDKVTERELLLATRDPQKAGDLDMFIYLALAEPGIIFYFPKGSTAPHRSNLGTVEDAVKAVLDQASGDRAQVQLAAYADEPGAAAINLALSGRRAQTIQALLVSRGINAALIQSETFGDKQPPRPPASPDAEESLNRRVAVTLSPFKP